MTFLEVCVCGHPVSRHELAGTEYARCRSFPGVCRCSGGIRVAVLVEEDWERPSGTQTNGKYFRRKFEMGREHPLDAGCRRLREEGIGYEWAVEDCDECGAELGVGEDFSATALIESSVDSLGSTVLEITGRNLLLCADCIGVVGV